MRNILIGGAWPYANGSLHIGHIAGLLPGDVLARYHRAAGDNVYFVSGSDCHGTPVAIRAKKEGKTPEEISDSYHAEFVECFEWLGFSYDVYTKTSAEAHKDFVREFHKKLYESEYVYEKETAQAYCAPCGTFLADRFVVGKCPVCGSDARGDQCDACGAVLEPENLAEARCAVCGKPIGFRNSRHLYIAVSKMERQLRKLEEERPQWRKNAVAFTERYIREGLRDRALTRDLDWGISVPREGYEGKTIYIWAENVLGYLSASKVAADRREGEESPEFEALWGEDAKHYYVHGKDNIPFHTIILPALLIAHGVNWHLPDQIVSSEYMTLEGRKISTSQNYAVWVKELQQCCEPDSVRYFFLANGPEKKDADFSWREYVNSHNGELLGAYGNFVNRSLSFIQKYWDGIVPEGAEDAEISETIERLFSVTGELIEKACFKDAIGGIFDFVRSANKYFDTQKPWATRKATKPPARLRFFSVSRSLRTLRCFLRPFCLFPRKKYADGWESGTAGKSSRFRQGTGCRRQGFCFRGSIKRLRCIQTSVKRDCHEGGYGFGGHIRDDSVSFLLRHIYLNGVFLCVYRHSGFTITSKCFQCQAGEGRGKQKYLLKSYRTYVILVSLRHFIIVSALILGNRSTDSICMPFFATYCSSTHSLYREFGKYFRS